MSAKASAKKKTGAAEAAAARAPEPRTATVQEVHAHAQRLLESVAIMRRVADEVLPRFYPQPLTSHPELLLLRRTGGGARPAHVDAILNAELAIREAARKAEEQGRALLEVVLDVGVLPTPEEKAPVEIDEVVRLKDLQAEYAYAASTPK